MGNVAQLRDEQREIDRQADSLSALIRGEVFGSLPEAERDLLYRQRAVLLELSIVLGKRLALE